MLSNKKMSKRITSVGETAGGHGFLFASPFHIHLRHTASLDVRIRPRTELLARDSFKSMDEIGPLRIRVRVVFQVQPQPRAKSTLPQNKSERPVHSRGS